MYLKHILKAMALVAVFTSVVLGFLAWVGTIVYLCMLAEWWSVTLALILSLLTLAVPIGTMNYMDEKDEKELQAKIDEVWRA